MSDPYFTALRPMSLVMRKMECMYCHAEDTRTVQIEHMFGLKVCDSHVANAKRDCNAWLHEKNLVRFKDARKIPVIEKFLAALEIGEFSVERSDLTIQPGWNLKKDNSSWDPAFFTCPDGKWCVPVYNHELTKIVPIVKFLNPDLFKAPPDFQSVVEGTLDCLLEGIYRKDHEEFQKALELDRIGSVREIEDIAHILHEGVATRIFVPSNRPLAVEPTDPHNVPD